jgi:hypothetical protein
MFGNIETVFKGQFTNGNYTNPKSEYKNKLLKNVWFLSLTTNMPPKKTLIFRKQLKVSNIPYPYPARIFG